MLGSTINERDHHQRGHTSPPNTKKTRPTMTKQTSKLSHDPFSLLTYGSSKNKVGETLYQTTNTDQVLNWWVDPLLGRGPVLSGLRALAWAKKQKTKNHFFVTLLLFLGRFLC